MTNSFKKAGIISGTFLAVLLSAWSVAAQPPSLKSTVDSKAIMIGEQLNLKITATYNPLLYKVNWVNVPDSIAHFEVVDRKKIDTVETSGLKILEQTIVLTSFDSGSWHTPPLQVNFDPVHNTTAIQLFTDSFLVKVAYVADTSKNLKDIKPIRTVEVTDPLWYYILGGILAIVVIIGGIILYRHLNKKKAATIFDAKVGAYTEALQEMEKLRTLDLSKSIDIKMYHTRLSEIFRRYASRKQKLNLMNRTTGDLLTEFRSANMNQDQTAKLAAALRCGDAVKFAKYQPAVYESEQCFADLKDTIQAMEKMATEKLNKTTASK
ncbi:MAG: hypothetical protein ABJA78_12935 [Ferruginibacter sp.]